MKKNITVNISGIIFHIDEDAYERLNKYLDSIKKHYKTSEGAGEIFNDIETRIADLLKEKLNDKKQVITIEDVEGVITVMGQPHEFEADEADEESQKTYRASRSKRLFRDPDNKIIAGVASGLGAYLKADPLIFRLIFVALIFVGGSGLIIYLLMWIFVPEALTTADKLEMEGADINISTIEKKIKEEINRLETKLNDLTDKAKQAYKKKKKD